MKKILLILLILLCGCEKEVAVETIIETNSNVLIGINYPKTDIKKLDKQINEYIENIYDSFMEEYSNFHSLNNQTELNIDYQYFKAGKYTNVILYTYINSSTLAHPITEIKTFVYDNDIISLAQIIDLDMLKKIIPLIKQDIITKYKDCVFMDILTSEIIPDFNKYQYFTINENNLTLYFERYKVTSGNCGIININIPLEKIGIEINKKEEETKKTFYKNKKVIDPSLKTVAITFDDGPSKYTDKILDLLNEYNANATFFVLGNKVNIYKDTIVKALSLGNEIGNHSYNHKWLTSLNEEEFKNQINKTQDIIYNLTGYTPKLLRPTYGSINNKIKNNTDLQIVLWNVDSKDWNIKNSKKIAERVLKDVDDMDIILFHDTYESTLKALEIIIPDLIEKGYQLVTVSELEEIKLLRKK